MAKSIQKFPRTRISIQKANTDAPYTIHLHATEIDLKRLFRYEDDYLHPKWDENSRHFWTDIPTKIKHFFGYIDGQSSNRVRSRNDKTKPTNCIATPFTRWEQGCRRNTASSRKIFGYSLPAMWHHRITIFSCSQAAAVLKLINYF